MRHRFVTMRALIVSGALVWLAQVSAAAPDSYTELVRKAQERSEAQDWRAAAPLWQQVVEINPTVAMFWYALGTAWSNAGEYRKAIPALEKSRELGAGSITFFPSYDIARAYGRLGEKKPTLEWLETALDDGFRSRETIRNEEAFTFLRGDAEFKKLANAVDRTEMSPAQGWRSDLSFLETEYARLHYSPYRKISQPDFEREIGALADAAGKVSDNEMRVRLMKLLAKAGDGHTGAYPEMMPTWKTTLPLQFELYREGLYIISADPSHVDLVGAQVLQFGKHSSEQVIEALQPAMSKDNEQAVWRSARYLRFPQMLNGLGLVPSTDKVSLTIKDANGEERSVTVEAVPNDPQFSRIFGHPSWVTAYDKTPGPLPLYLKDRRTFYWFEPLPDGKTLYCQFNNVSDGQQETLQAFADRLAEHIEKNGIETLIIDMRWNNGGNSKLLPALMASVIRTRVNRQGNLFVIVGRYTYSAAMNAATFFERFTNSIFVGEPTPSSPNFIGESNMITLPYSQTRVSISDLYWESSWPTDRRTWIAPFLYTPPTFEAYKNKRDLALEAILTYGEGN